MHINKPEDSKHKESREESWRPGRSGRSPPPVVLPCSLLELQRPDVLRPASPPFGFLIRAANCAFQDFVLGRQEATGEGEKQEATGEREKQEGEEEREKKKKLEVFLPSLIRLCPGTGEGTRGGDGGAGDAEGHGCGAKHRHLREHRGRPCRGACAELTAGKSQKTKPKQPKQTTKKKNKPTNQPQNKQTKPKTAKRRKAPRRHSAACRGSAAALPLPARC